MKSKPQNPLNPNRRMSWLCCFGHLRVVNGSDDCRRASRLGHLDDVEADERLYLSVDTRRRDHGLATGTEFLGIHHRPYAPKPGSKRIQVLIEHGSF